MKFRTGASEEDKQTAAITRSSSKKVVRMVFQSVLVSELCRRDTKPPLHTPCFIANKFSGPALSVAAPLFLFFTHSLSIAFTLTPFISHPNYLLCHTAAVKECWGACVCVCVCVCVSYVNEVCKVCIFKLVEQRGGEKVTGNERCLTAVVLLMRVSPCPTLTGMKMMGQREISLF